MRAALEVCGEFLSRIGALEGANAIAEILHKSGVELSEESSFRWRALLAAIRQELTADPMDVVFLFERLLQLNAMMPSGPSFAFFGSPLFLHLLVERFAVAFEGLDAELFKLESDELCHAEGIFETCVLIRDKIGAYDGERDCWDAFYELYHLNDLSFRRDMKRALSMIESVTLGPTKLELAFPTEGPRGSKKVISRALLEKRFEGTRLEWRNLSQINSITNAEAEAEHDANEEHNQEAEAQPESNVNGDASESELSEISDEPVIERTIPSRPPRAAEVARAARQEVRRSLQVVSVPNEVAEANDPDSTAFLRAGPKTRRRWSREEEAALMEGYRAYQKYSNVWVLIKAKYPDVFNDRTNVNLKDKYRNLVKYGRIQRSSNATDEDGQDDSIVIV
uniref:Myb-like domain-containing protein n=1 Tax=Phytophthora ramorum TaxID=164328 RepID=H3GLN1_PHYRM